MDNYQAQDKYKGYPMKWHKWLIYFALIAGGILTLLDAVKYFTGSIYYSAGVEPWQVYRLYPMLKTADILYGAAMVAVAVMAFVTRSKLAQMKTDGPQWLTRYYLAGIAAYVVYGVLYGMSTNMMSTALAMVAKEVAGNCLMLWLNKKYYEKRKELFVNV